MFPSLRRFNRLLSASAGKVASVLVAVAEIEVTDGIGVKVALGGMGLDVGVGTKISVAEYSNFAGWQAFRKMTTKAIQRGKEYLGAIS